jgi:UDP-glucose:tetrahydrobiopterin glucosyltransferase
MRILLCSTPVGPLGSGIGGGVELTLHGLVYGLTGLGHEVEVVAPAGSLHVGSVVHQVEGTWQASSQVLGRDEPITMPPGSVLAAMWDLVRAEQDRFDVIVNLAYDWLPLYLTPFLRTPVAHLVSMGSTNEVMDEAIDRAASVAPGCIAVHSRAQADTYPGGERFAVLGNGIAVERYDLRPVADDPPWLAFVGRISPEKGLGDVAALSARTGLPVRAWGLLQDPEHWAEVLATHPGASLTHEGFLATDDLQAAIGGASALVMTPKWVEAFGNVAIEAMACGVPVVAYRRGGPAEIVEDGVTGFLVEPDDVDALVDAVGRIDRLDRRACRRRVEQRYSTAALAERVAGWLTGLVAGAVRAPLS